jgi:alpha/beta hydrolase family protein DUF900
MNSRHQVRDRALQPSRFYEPIPRTTGAGENKLAVLIPGIRTNAEWIDQAITEMETFSDPIQMRKAFGGRISSFHLLTRVGLSSIRNEVRKQLNQIVADNPNVEISLICHSMGTDIIIDILEELEYSFKYIFFIGSVCHRKRALIISRSCEFFVNHRGTFDPWPIIASIVRPFRYSHTGTFGFGSGAYLNEFRFNNNHETCTNNNHVYDYILKVISGTAPEYPQKISQPFNYNLCHYIKLLIYISLFIGIIFAKLISYYTLLFPASVIFASLFYFLKNRTPS